MMVDPGHENRTAPFLVADSEMLVVGLRGTIHSLVPATDIVHLPLVCGYDH